LTSQMAAMILMLIPAPPKALGGTLGRP